MIWIRTRVLTIASPELVTTELFRYPNVNSPRSKAISRLLNNPQLSVMRGSIYLFKLFVTWVTRSAAMTMVSSCDASANTSASFVRASSTTTLVTWVMWSPACAPYSRHAFFVVLSRISANGREFAREIKGYKIQS